jgi:nicotinate phosphoribosyltransferase
VSNSCQTDSKCRTCEDATDSTALLTDHYELTMLDAALEAGVGDRRCVFELFTRSLPPGRRYGVVGGVARAMDLLDRFVFDDAVLAHLRERGFLHAGTLDWMAEHRFGGDVTAFRDGEVHMPDEPVLTVEGTFAETVVLETLLLSVLNHDSAVAAAAARMLDAAGGRGMMEFGSRRTHEQAAAAAGATSVLLGFAGTSNLEAGRRFGVPTLGTSAHAFTMLFADELTSFEAQVQAFGPGTTLLVDTYDTPTGIENAVKAAGTDLGAVRIDSGDLFEEAVAARRQLDALGATGTHIVVSGDLDEYEIARLADAPVDAYGVGTRLVTGSGAPTAGFVYKLVARALDDGAPAPVAKSSEGKATRGGRKHTWRRLADGVAVEDVVTTDDAPLPDARPLQVARVRDGRRVTPPAHPTTAEHHRAAMAELPARVRDLSDGDPGLPVRFPGS